MYCAQNMIDPYSNWRGPIWVISNVLLSYGMAQYGYSTQAAAVASSVVSVLAADLNTTATWHECYDSGALCTVGLGRIQVQVA